MKVKILRIILIAFLCTIVFIGVKKYTPTSKAEVTTIQVTYTAGEGIGESITLTQEIYDNQTQGEYDYTDGKIVFIENGTNGVSFTHESKEITINGTVYTYDVLLSGWKLTAVAKNGEVLETATIPTNYDYTDKTNASKDIGTVYSELGWYVVPDDVVSVTVEAVWGWAIYARDPDETMVYDTNYWFDTASSVASGRTGASDANFGTSIDDAVASLKRAYEILYLAGESGASYDVYSHMIVLCGDLHDVRPSTSTVPTTTYTDVYEGETIYDVNSANTSLCSTQSAYNSYWAYSNRADINVTITSNPSSTDTYYFYEKNQTWGWNIYGGLRFDNVVYSLVEAVNGSSITLASNILYYYDRSGDNDSKFITTERFHTYSPNATSDTLDNWILTVYHFGHCDEVRAMGGSITIATRDHAYSADINCSSLKYILIGGNCHLNYYYGGTSSELNPSYLKTIYDLPTLCITGGYITNIYLTGQTTVNSITLSNNDGIYFYMSDGYVASNIYGSGGTPLNSGDVHITINGGKVRYLYGGGSKEDGIINGDVYINLSDMQIGLSSSITGVAYGGSQYGNINGDTTLNMNNVTVYGTVFGAGYGTNATKTAYVGGASSIASLKKDKTEIIELLQEAESSGETEIQGDIYKLILLNGVWRYYVWSDRIDEYLEDATFYLGFYDDTQTRCSNKKLYKYE